MSALDRFNLDDISGAENVEAGSDIYWDLQQRFLHERRRTKKVEERKKKKEENARKEKQLKKKVYQKAQPQIKRNEQLDYLEEYDWQVKSLTRGDYFERPLGKVKFNFGERTYITDEYCGPIPGVKLNSKELEAISQEHVHRCGRLRDIHTLANRFTGLCALDENFGLCRYPQIIKPGWLKDCALENEFQKQAVVNYQRELSEEKNQEKKQINSFKFKKLEPVEYNFKLVKRAFVYQRTK